MASRLIWIVLALGLALYGLLANDPVLGLDLAGGVTMRYELLPPDDRVRTGEERDAMIDASVETLRNRIDSYGIKESNVTRQGEHEIVIELPGYGKEEADTIKSVVARVGLLEFRIVLRRDGTDDDVRNGVVVAEEEERLAALLSDEANQGRPPGEIDVTSLDIQAPDVLYRWVPYATKIVLENRGRDPRAEVELEQVLAQQPLTTRDYEFVRFELQESRRFTGSDISEAYQSLDNRQAPAVAIGIRPARSAEFGDWTGANQGRQMAMLLDGRVAERPATIEDRLEGSFIIRSGSIAGFNQAEIKDYLTVIKSGSLQMKPRLLFENTVGPSLGEAAIDAGIKASIAGFLATILFMLAYYRWHGLVATVCLFVNMTLLAGILMLLGATITLPGVAGLVLTLGMAVDSNILVFERFREEADRAKSFGQVVKLGFEKAFSTIVDANVTSFVTAAILYKVGTGPVRGFAVILMLGILTSVFSVLVVGRFIYDALVARGFHSTNMGRVFKQETHYPFMGKARPAAIASTVLVVASLVAFFAADRDKYGLDFLGGYKAQVVLGQPAAQADVARAVGGVFPTAQVVSVLDEAAPEGAASTQFLVKVKALPGELAEDDLDLEARYEEPLKEALAGLILPDFAQDVVVQENLEQASTRVEATLHFTAPVEPGQVAARLGFLSGLTTEAAPGGAVRVAGTWPRIGVDESLAVQRLRSAVTADAELPAPSEPFLESTTIGGRVGTELRDSAIRALLLSFVAIVLYIRVRFREYRYGIAAIVAIFHDVAITLGIVALMHFSGVVDIEIDLAMIAAFLTIIGYSLNDTIVVFDRIRENLPRMAGKRLSEVIDISVNQTLARTLLTSSTTLVALAVIFYFNYGRQNVLEGFSFAMIVGILVGTYSSIFVASPVLVYLAGREQGRRPSASPPERSPPPSRASKHGVPT